MKRCSASLLIGEMQIKTTFTKLAKVKQTNQIKYCQNVGQMKLSEATGGNLKGTASLENILTFSYKFEGVYSKPTQALLPGKFHGWRSLVGYSQGKELDMTERLPFPFLSIVCTYCCIMMW